MARQLQIMPEEPELKMSEILSSKRIGEADSEPSSDEEENAHFFLRKFKHSSVEIENYYSFLY